MPLFTTAACYLILFLKNGWKVSSANVSVSAERNIGKSSASSSTRTNALSFSDPTLPLLVVTSHRWFPSTIIRLHLSIRRHSFGEPCTGEDFGSRNLRPAAPADQCRSRKNGRDVEPVD